MNKYASQSRKAQRSRIRARSCENKKAFESADEARQKGQDIYKCRHCGKWHRTGQLASLLALTRRIRA